MVRRLAGRSARRRHRPCRIQGPQAVREALAHIPDQLRDVYLTHEADRRRPELAARASGIAGRLHHASPEVLEAMSGDAQGVIAVARFPDETPRLTALLGTGLVLVLAEASDPGNLGTLIRTADAAGAGGVITGEGSVEVYNPEVVRATAGSLFHLPILPDAALSEALAELRGHGWQLLAADGAGEWSLTKLSGAGAPDLTKPTAWLLGNEARGLSAHQLGWADAVVRVPIYGAAESLNVATAAAVCLYASASAQREARPS